jgi:hypothetical protein
MFSTEKKTVLYWRLDFGENYILTENHGSVGSMDSDTIETTCNPITVFVLKEMPEVTWFIF